MQKLIFGFCVSVFCLLSSSWAAEVPKPGYAPMAIFEPLVGKAWRGEGTGPDGKKIVDIARYEMILDGRAFQATHRLDDGSYGGRTIFFFDEAAKEYVFHYFTTAGFMTSGTLEQTDTGFTAIEAVIGHDTYREVRSEVIFGDGKIDIKSSHITHDGEVSAGEGRTYTEIDDPGPLF
ncbi:hypothetical protein [Hyphococcus sp. DH-69]|uniref:hypothetical protein n=1 Tax=Hyphococcus formosus TaxID=3143534 RepID=UPI00398B8761